MRVLPEPTPEPYSNGYFASLVAMARHWYKLGDPSVTYRVERSPMTAETLGGSLRSLPRFSPEYVTFDLRVDMMVNPCKMAGPDSNKPTRNGW